MKGVWGFGVACVVMTGCAGLPENEIRARSASPEQSSASAEASTPHQEVWCATGAAKGTRVLVVEVLCPGRDIPFVFPLEMSRCGETGSALSAPDLSVLGDSMEPRAWSNGGVTLSDTTDEAATLTFSISWHDADGSEAECGGSAQIRMDEEARQMTLDGITIVTRPSVADERSNNALQPIVGAGAA